MRSFIRIILFFALLLSHLFSSAQEHGGFCGTVMSHSSAASSLHAIPGYFGCNVINKVERTLQISLHICLNSFGGQGIAQSDIDGALDRLNNDFFPCGIQFTYCATEVMEDNRFDSLDVYDYHNEEVQMLSIYYEPNTINIYLVDTIGKTGFPGISGYAYAPGGPDVIVIEKDSYNFDEDTPSHEMGHFFGLLHTFETEFGVELADGSNCQLSGDFICDTEADPDPDGSADPDDQCNYTGVTMQDSNGDWYVPPTDNLMSYYPGECKCRFTPQQYNRMIEQYLTIRNYLW